MGVRSLAGMLAPVPAFFAVRIASALLLLKLSAIFLTVGSFATFSQLLLFASLLNLIAVGGTQNGLIRQSAAAIDDLALARTKAAGLTIWAACAPVLLLVIMVAGRRISHVLTGSPDHVWAVALIGGIALAAGPGQVWCSILSGRRRVAASLSAQAVGLLVGTAAAGWQISRGNAVPAAIAFACGSLATMALAGWLVQKFRIVRMPMRMAAEVRALLGYSGALAATTGFSSVVLFGLRSLYREQFDPTALGYWLAANRISDMSTQLLGLFMIQFFVPHVAGMDRQAERRSVIVRCWAAATGAIAIGIAAFWTAPIALVRLFLSDSFVPAIPVIGTYMVGDMLRVSASLAMFAAFASGRPWRYAGIEIATVSIMAVVAVLLIGAGDPRAPQIAYVSAYALTAIVVWVSFLWKPAPRRVTA